MSAATPPSNDEPTTASMSLFERYLSLWIALCIAGGIALGKVAPNLAGTLDGMAIRVNNAPVVSIPIAICLFFMMYPIMVKIDFASVARAGRSTKPVLLTLIINWCVKPYTMYAISFLFLGVLFRGLIGADAAIPFDRLDIVARAAELRHPILILHSDDDGFVPSDASHALALARPDLVELQVFSTARHTKLWNYDQDRWTTAITDWVTASGAPASSPA